MKITRNEDIFFRKEAETKKEVDELLQDEEADDKGYITLIDSGTMHQLNYLGGRIWELCDGSRNLFGIVDVLSGEFDVDEEDLKSDIEDFIEELMQRGWLQYG